MVTNWEWEELPAISGQSAMVLLQRFPWLNTSAEPNLPSPPETSSLPWDRLWLAECWRCWLDGSICCIVWTIHFQDFRGVPNFIDYTQVFFIEMSYLYTKKKHSFFYWFRAPQLLSPASCGTKIHSSKAGDKEGHDPKVTLSRAAPQRRVAIAAKPLVHSGRSSPPRHRIIHGEIEGLSWPGRWWCAIFV